jgi:predicted DNA-binding transcriptional regulator AlpA
MSIKQLKSLPTLSSKTSISKLDLHHPDTVKKQVGDGGSLSETLNAEIFTTDEAAHYTRMAIPTLHRFRLTGEGPVFAKLGGCVRYRRRDLDAWINSRLCRSTSDYPKQ